MLSNIVGGFTPVCNNCGVHLCWDISELEYLNLKHFWDNWKCENCDPNAKGSRKRYRKVIYDIQTTHT